MLPRSLAVRLLLCATLTVLLAGLLLPRVATAATESYVAMGDSFTAGPVIPNQLPEAGGCMRSDHNYPHLVARATAAVLRDASCSGATTRDLTAPQAVTPRRPVGRAGGSPVTRRSGPPQRPRDAEDGHGRPGRDDPVAQQVQWPPMPPSS